MKLTLEDVKIYKATSEETTRFNAAIFIDGERAGIVNNRGTGGMHEIDWCFGKRGSEWLGDAYKDWLDNQTIVATVLDGLTTIDTLAEKLEAMIDEAFLEWEDVERLKRQCKTKTLYRLKGQECPAEWLVINATYCELTKHRLQKMFGDNLHEIANERFV